MVGLGVGFGVGAVGAAVGGRCATPNRSIEILDALTNPR